MKYENTKHGSLIVSNFQFNKRYNSIRKVFKSFYKKQNISGLLSNRRLSTKSRISFSTKKSINSNKIDIMKDIQLNKDLNGNITNKNETIVDINRFYNIRKEIYNNIIKPYITPYLEHSYVQKKYSTNLMEVSSEVERGNIYDYYQISYLMNKNIKNYKLIARFRDSVLFNDDQEYLMRFFSNDEIYIIMNYLLYQIYDKDDSVISKKNNKKTLYNEILMYLSNKLEDNSSIIKEDFNIRENEELYTKYLIYNLLEKDDYLKNLKPLLKKKIEYLYITNVPKYLIPNCSPNIFPNLSIQSNNLKLYLYLRKDNIGNKVELLLDNKEKDKKVSSITKRKNINKKYQNDINGEIIKENVFEDITSEEDKKVEFPELQYKSIIIQDNKENEQNNEIKEIEKYLYKFNDTLCQSKEKKEKYYLFEPDNIKYKQMQKLNSFKNKINENKSKVKDNIDNSLIENKKNIIKNNRKLFAKIAKKKFFKTLVNGTVTNSKFDKNTSQKSTYYNPNTIFKDQKNEINIFDSNINFTRNKKVTNKMTHIIKKFMFRPKSNNLSFVKNKSFSVKSTSKSFFSPYKELLGNFGDNKTFVKYLDNNMSSKYLKKSISENILNIIYKRNNKISFENNIGRVSKSKSQLCNLYEFEQFYNEIKNKGLLPKNLKYTNAIVHKPFDAPIGFKFFKNTNNKNNSKHIDEEENKTLNDYILQKIKMNIKQKKNEVQLFCKNNYSLNSMVKCPNLYIH